MVAPRRTSATNILVTDLVLSADFGCGSRGHADGERLCRSSQVEFGVADPAIDRSRDWPFRKGYR